MGLDFPGINRRALDILDRLCEEWLPGGRVRGHEYQCSDLRGGEGSSLSVNLSSGVWCDFANPQDTGSDPISLLAAVRGIPQGEAAKELADILGMPPGQDAPRPPAPKRQRKEQAQPVIPVPDDVPAPTFKHPDDWGAIVAKWEYRDAAGRLMFYVVRFKTPQGGKDVRPYSWAKDDRDRMRWCWKGPVGDALRPLYGLDRLAANPDANVLVVEGERTADAAQRLFPGLVCVAWLGGTTQAKRGTIDLTPLQGRKVVLWPDADWKNYKDPHPKAGELMPYWEQPGESAMLSVAVGLRGIAQGIRIVGTPQPPPVDGWDLADAEAEGWTPEKAMAYLKEHMRDPIEKPAEEPPIPPAAEEPPPHDEIPEGPGDEEPPALPPADDEPPVAKRDNPFYVALGHDHGDCVYLSIRSGQIVKLSGGSHGKLSLLQLAPLHFWEREYPGKNGCQWDRAASDQIDRCHMLGIWDDGRIRGRGCWWDRDRLVVHLGDRLVVNGRSLRPTEFESGYVYEQGSHMPGPAGTPMDAREARRVVEIAKQFAWEMPASAALLCGWIALAPVCGALRWRPHVWISGGPGSGKSTVLGQFLAPLCAGTEINVQGNSTEAGIRQTLRADARPVIFDESEGNDDRERSRIQSIMSLIRQSSTEGGARTLKGSATGQATSFHIRSMFALASISVGIKQQADYTRMPILSLRSSNSYSPEEAAARQQRWHQLEAELDAVAGDRDFAQRLLARIVLMIPTIQKNIKTFTKVCARHFGNQRLGDTYGTLLAGCYALWADGEATEEQAQGLIDRFSWQAYTEPAEEDESAAALSSIMQIPVRVDTDHGPVNTTAGELVATVAGRPRGQGVSVPVETADQTLRRYGLRVVPADKILMVANKSDQLARALRDRPWGHDWRSYLRRIRGSESVKPCQYSPGHVSRGTSVPLDAVLGDA